MNTLDGDVVVVGGGPAGSTAAATLALRGRSVVLLEKASFPRYHIGESMLPYCWWTLERIGALDAVKAVAFQSKHSVQFVTPDGVMSRPFMFTEHLKHEAASTWQVERADFDRVLLQNARDKGVQVHERTVAREVLYEDGQVAGLLAEGPDGPVRVRARVIIDASGRDGFIRHGRGWNVREPHLERVALWTYFEGTPRAEGLHEGATTVVSMPEDGWFWHIPMRRDRLSLGIVARADVVFKNTRELEEAFAEQVALHPWVAARAAAGRRVPGEPVHVTRDYSYRSRFSADDGVVLCGDAFAFLDPVFSSGVLLATRTGEEAALAVDQALATGDVSAAAFADYGAWACKGVEHMRALVWSFYEPTFSMGKLMRARPDLRGDVTDLLIGDLFREYDELFAALGQYGVVPETLGHGGARVAEVGELGAA